MPWLKQWHNEVDPEYGLRMGDYYADFVDDEAQALGLTAAMQVRAWQPPATGQGHAGGGRRHERVMTLISDLIDLPSRSTAATSC